MFYIFFNLIYIEYFQSIYILILINFKLLQFLIYISVVLITFFKFQLVYFSHGILYYSSETMS